MTLLRKVYSPSIMDLLFGFLALAGFAGIFRVAGLEIPPVTPPSDPVFKSLALSALAIACGFLALVTTKIDQRLADDYVFQMLAKSALMAIVAFIFAFACWNLALAAELGRLGSYATMALLIVCWSVSYFIVRLRGTRA